MAGFAPITRVPKMESLDLVVKSGKTSAKEYTNKAKALLASLQVRTVTLVKNPEFRTICVGSASGGVLLGAVGGSFGTACGIVVGTATGAVPALFTFGLSLPICGGLGAAIGCGVGTMAGSGAGLLGGGAAGCGGYRYRVEIKDGLVYIKSKASRSTASIRTTADSAVLRTQAQVSSCQKAAKESFIVVVDGVKVRSTAAMRVARATASDRKVQVTAASTTAGAMVGGMAGTATGGAIGAGIGLVPALFTFGLSIPVCAVVGGGMGLCAGTATGAVGGGLVGYGGTHRKELSEGAKEIWAKVCGKAEYAKSQTIASAEYAKKTTLASADYAKTNTLAYADYAKSKAVDAKMSIKSFSGKGETCVQVKAA